ncbi:unnamed protein product [Hymenolepis diminuta]|uniref:UBC core domain-containing protein n=1 Tax=Hymenolepis diminuta TaxID=6216 RepID=A0A0R3SV03_HYMDI|nr:unnamed protein product [Hymenolepis diminuta]
MNYIPRRIHKERETLLTEPVEGIKVAVDESNNRYFCAIIEGPKDSPYEGGFFKLQLFLPEDYPHKPPRCLFMTKIYHPNIDQIGRICLDTKWSAALHVRTVLLSIQALLATPNPNDFLANHVTAEWRQNEAGALQTEVEIDETNARFFHVIVNGPKDSPYEGGRFKLQLFLPEEYPMTAPKCLFLTKIYHPNIDNVGRICLDILKEKWSPALQIRTVLLSIQALLSAPNPDDPLANDVASQWKSDEAQAIKIACEWTRKYANPSQSEEST